MNKKLKNRLKRKMRNDNKMMKIIDNHLSSNQDELEIMRFMYMMHNKHTLYNDICDDCGKSCGDACYIELDALWIVDKLCKNCWDTFVKWKREHLDRIE